MTELLIVLMFESVVSGASRVLAQRFATDGRPKLIIVRQVFAMIPLLMALPFVNITPRPALMLALLMLTVAVTSLLLTMCMYKISYKENIPSPLPSSDDLKQVLRILAPYFR